MAIKRKFLIYGGAAILLISLILLVSLVKKAPSLKSCLEFGGDICRTDELCNGEYLDASDTFSCCSIECASAKLPSDIGSFEQTTENEELGDVIPEEITIKSKEDFVLKTCGMLKGDICNVGEDCAGTWLDAFDTFNCCSTKCKSLLQESLEIDIFDQAPENEGLGDII